MPTPVPGPQLRPHPRDRLRSLRLRRPAARRPRPAEAPARAVAGWSSDRETRDTAAARRYVEPPEVHERNLWLGARVIAGDDDHVLLGVRVRVLLPALAQQQRPVAPGGCRPAAGLRDRDRPPLRRSAPALLAYAAWAAREKPRLAGRGGDGTRRSGSPAAWCRCSSTRISTSVPTDGGYASVFIGWTALFVVFVILAMYWVEIVFADGRAQSRRGGGVRAGRARRRRLLLEPAGGHRRARLGDPLPVLSRAHRRRCL